MTQKTDSKEVAQREPGAVAPQTVWDIFKDDRFKQQVALALPKHIGVDNMMRVCMTEVRLSEKLQKCSGASLMGAMLKAAQAGLRPGMFGEGWLIPRWNNRLKCFEADFEAGYMGIAQLAYRSGVVSGVHMAAVYKADHFRYVSGTEETVEHVPDLTAEHSDDEILLFYAVVKLKDGEPLVKVMPRKDVDAVRDRFAPRDPKTHKIVGPWVTDYEAMGCKTALIRCLKLAPKESERLQFALQAEQDALFGDRLAGGVVDVPKTAEDRVAQKLGAVEVETETGEVIEADIVAEGTPVDAERVDVPRQEGLL